MQAGRDQRFCVSLAAGVATLSLQDGDVVDIVARHELGLTLELCGDGAELQLHDAAVHLAFDLLQLGALHAWGDALDVGEHCPRLLDRAIDGELVHQWFHRSRSSRVSMSATDPMHATG